MSFQVTKSASGAYRWQGISSTNARDRDAEIVSEAALTADVSRTKSHGDNSELWLYHVPYRIGGAPDFRAVVNGHLVESGEFDDTPHAKAIAEYIASTPDGPDGNGWGMSIGFRGAREDDRTFNNIVISERSILPLTKAANPFTAFRTGGVEMALTNQQKEFLETLANNPEVRDAAKAIIGAAEQSKALDSAGVERKSADVATYTADDIARRVVAQLTDVFAQTTGPITAQVKAEAEPVVEVSKEAITNTSGAQYAHGPDGLNNQPGTSAPPKRKAKPTAAQVAADDEDSEDAPDDEAAEGESDEGMKDQEKPAKKKSLDGLTVDDLADLIDTHVKATMQGPLQEIASILKMQADLIAQRDTELKTEKALNADLEKRFNTPRIALAEQLASRAKATTITDDDPLVKAADAALDKSADVFSELGFPGKKGL